MTELEIIAEELRTDPLGLSYATMTPAEVEQALLSVYPQSPTVVVTTPLSVLGLMDRLGVQETGRLLAAIEAEAATNPALAWVLSILKTGGTLDFGAPSTRATFDDLTAKGVITIQDANAIKALAERRLTRAEELGLPTTGLAQLVTQARERYGV